jgi:hypothetical protein
LLFIGWKDTTREFPAVVHRGLPERIEWARVENKIDRKDSEE